MEIRVENIVVKADLGVTLPLKDLALKHPAFTYNPKRFAATVLRLNFPDSPRCTSLIFSSGKMIITGTRSPSMARLAVLEHARFLKRLDVPVRLRSIAFVNMVCSAHLPFQVDLHRLCQVAPLYATFSPQVFPGVQITLHDSVTKNYTVFSTGAVNIVGRCLMRETVDEANRFFLPLMLQARAPAQLSPAQRPRKKSRKQPPQTPLARSS